MTPENWDDQDREPVEPEHFDLAAAECRFHHPGMVEAARAVLVDGMRSGEAAIQFGITHQTHLSRALTKIEAKWIQICKREHWSCRTIVLSEDDMALVQRLQVKTVAPLRERQTKAEKKKRSKSPG